MNTVPTTTSATTSATTEGNPMRTNDNRPARGRGAVRSWPLLLLAAPAFVAVWSGWVGLGELTGFGDVHPLPGIAPDLVLNTAITLPIGVETYAAYALKVWLSPGLPAAARSFARWSALGSLLLGAAGQVAYHLMTAAGITAAPWQITAAVACLPVGVLGMGAALAHLVHADDTHDGHVQADDDVHAVDVQAERVDDVPVVAVRDEAYELTRPAGPLAVTARRRAASRTSGGTDTAARIARLRERHPDLSTAEIARRLGVTDRTVRRHLTTTATTTATTAGTAPADGSAVAA